MYVYILLIFICHTYVNFLKTQQQKKNRKVATTNNERQEEEEKKKCVHFCLQTHRQTIRSVHLFEWDPKGKSY